MSDGQVTNPGSPEALEQQVEREREQLAQTVEALQAKLDVKANAKAKAAHMRDKATTDSGRPSPVVLGVAAAVVGIGALLWWRSRH